MWSHKPEQKRTDPAPSSSSDRVMEQGQRGREPQPNPNPERQSRVPVRGHIKGTKPPCSSGRVPQAGRFPSAPPPVVKLPRAPCPSALGTVKEWPGDHKYAEDMELNSGRAGGAKAGRAAPAHSGHRACKRGPGRAAGHLADGGQRAPRPPPRGSAADPSPAAAPGPLLPGPRPEPRQRSLSPAARPGRMEPGAVPRTTEPSAARDAAARHSESRRRR
ncbi:basic salivary proline-rich protein 3-like [Loxodonta africana]|uniref:basic salivary proline-rich protein 3-like n=1 Tax=Loxodonta africana TaxID=9785 RepID=UPI0030D59164